MTHECIHCTFQSSYKRNLKSHMKSKHNDKIPIEKDEGKSMKNHKNKIKKLEMMMKKNFQTGVEIETMKRKVKSLGDGNTNEFKQLVREYVELTGETLPKDYFYNFTYKNPPPPPPPAETPTNKNEHLFESTETSTNKNGNLFENADAIYIFRRERNPVLFNKLLQVLAQKNS